MGLTIHYRGILKAPDFIQPLSEEARAIAELMQWRHHPVDDGSFKGIILIPPGSELLILCFTPDGRLASPFYDSNELGWIFTKTQYAGMEAHIAIIRTFRYLSEKYFSTFELHDEGGFWETNDENELRLNWGEFEAAIGALGAALDAFPVDEGDQREDLADRLEEYLKQWLGRPKG